MLKWGEYGTRPGQFDGKDKLPNRTGGPNFVAVDRYGYVRAIEPGDGPGRFHTPHGLAFDIRGHLYVADSQQERYEDMHLGATRLGERAEPVRRSICW